MVGARAADEHVSLPVVYGTSSPNTLARLAGFSPSARTELAVGGLPLPATATRRRNPSPAELPSLCAARSASSSRSEPQATPLSRSTSRWGLLDSVDFRPCDSEARVLLGKRRDTVFAPPSRPLLAAATYADARALVEEVRKTNPQARSLSAQAFGLAPKVKEADDWMRAHPGTHAWLFECHPELSFRAIAEGRVLDDKKTAHGQVDRLRLIERWFPDALDVIAASRLKAGEAQLPDILDGYAALESALHVAAGDYEELGGETDSAGLVMRMVF